MNQTNQKFKTLIASPRARLQRDVYLAAGIVSPKKVKTLKNTHGARNFRSAMKTQYNDN